MRFLRKNKIDQLILVISDIHLGAGAYIKGQKNFLEDFHYDEELVDFLSFYSTGEFEKTPVELVINGDLFDLLAVPFVEYFDDEFWSEEAALAKLKMIIEAHPEVMSAFSEFIAKETKKITFIIGNHDGELVMSSLQEQLMNCFPDDRKERFVILQESDGEYSPYKGILLKHGHEYEVAHQFDMIESVVKNEEGRKFFIPPWGSYYVTRVVNKFKEERGHINAVRPIKKAMINGIIYDTLFTVRFLLATTFYFIMVRFIHFFKEGKGLGHMVKHSLRELELFRDYEELTKEIFEEREDIHCLIVGHTHEPVFRNYVDGNIFINTGTWTDMYHMDWARSKSGQELTYAQISISKEQNKPEISLNVWEGRNQQPFIEFS
jgi:UDP-2,3-diacylglucosamine pyrophosphatase LpxH